MKLAKLVLLNVLIILGILITYFDWVDAHILPPGERRSGNGLYEPPDSEIYEKVELIHETYWIYKTREDWFSAAEICSLDGRQLATFVFRRDAIKVIDALYQLSHFSEAYDRGEVLEELGLDRNYWIGLYDIGHEGKWEWLGKNLFLSYESLWTPNQPDHVDTEGLPLNKRHQHCVGLWNPYYHKTTPMAPIMHTFDDKECGRKLYFICQRLVQPKLLDVPPLHEVESFEMYSDEKLQELMLDPNQVGSYDDMAEIPVTDCDSLTCDEKYYSGVGWIPNLDQNRKRQCAGGILKCRRKTKFDTECLDKPEEFRRQNANRCAYLQMRYHIGDREYEFDE